MLIFDALYVLFLTFCLFFFQKRILIVIPILIAFNQTWFSFFFTLNTSSFDKIMINIEYYHAIFVLATGVWIIFTEKKFELYKVPFIFFVLFSIILLNSLNYTTDIEYSRKNVGKFISILVTFFAYASYVQGYPEFKAVMKSLLVSWALYVSYIVLTSVMQIGDMATYAGQSSIIYIGSLSFYELFPLSYFTFLLLVYFELSEDKSTRKEYIRAVFLGVVTFIIFLLILKRTYIYLPVLGLALYIFMGGRLKKLGTVMLLAIMVFGLLAITGLADFFLFSFMIRFDSIFRNPFEEGRFLEYVTYYEEIIKRTSLQTILFGTEIFNSFGKFFHVVYVNISDRYSRVLHSDYTNILFGAGMIGLFLYFCFLASMTYASIKIKERKGLRLVLIALMVTLIFNGFSDGILDYTNRYYPFLMIGALYGFLVHGGKYH